MLSPLDLERADALDHCQRAAGPGYIIALDVRATVRVAEDQRSPNDVPGGPRDTRRPKIVPFVFRPVCLPDLALRVHVQSLRERAPPALFVGEAVQVMVGEGPSDIE